MLTRRRPIPEVLRKRCSRRRTFAGRQFGARQRTPRWSNAGGCPDTRGCAPGEPALLSGKRVIRSGPDAFPAGVTVC